MTSFDVLVVGMTLSNGKKRQYYCDCPRFCKTVRAVPKSTYYNHRCYLAILSMVHATLNAAAGTSSTCCLPTGHGPKAGTNGIEEPLGKHCQMENFNGSDSCGGTNKAANYHEDDKLVCDLHTLLPMLISLHQSPEAMMTAQAGAMTGLLLDPGSLADQADTLNRGVEE